jgi:hypothetical protein
MDVIVKISNIRQKELELCYNQILRMRGHELARRLLHERYLAVVNQSLPAPSLARLQLSS